MSLNALVINQATILSVIVRFDTYNEEYLSYWYTHVFDCNLYSQDIFDHRRERDLVRHLMKTKRIYTEHFFVIDMSS
jgi:hypothetical protein